jgi:hypothetical protein
MSPSDKRCRPESTSTQADLVALAEDKLCDALSSSGDQEWRGLVVLTDERVICVDTRSQYLPLAEFGLARARPWERAAEIRHHLASAIAARPAVSADHSSTPEAFDRDSDA